MVFDLALKIQTKNAGVAELADARDLKSREVHPSYRFDSGHRHEKYRVESKFFEK